MALKTMIDRHPLILAEGSVIERIRREADYSLDGDVLNAGMIYDDPGRAILSSIYREYLEAARLYDLPILILTPTWRASRDRLERAGLGGADVNRDCVAFLRRIRDVCGDFKKKILIGGLMGCRGDAYDPGDALDEPDARTYHAYQAGRLAAAGVDLLLASTLPSSREAAGMAAAMAETGVPYLVSFVVRANGRLLDGTPLDEAIGAIDASVTPAPTYFMLNCVHPENVRNALGVMSETAGPSSELSQAAAGPHDAGRRSKTSPHGAAPSNVSHHGTAPLGGRLIGLQGNASRKSPEELDDSAELDADPPERWARSMLRLHTEHGMRILGGCCGAGNRYIERLAELYVEYRDRDAGLGDTVAVEPHEAESSPGDSAPIEPRDADASHGDSAHNDLRDGGSGRGGPAPVELPIDGTLDLHIFQPREVKHLVPDYLAACQERGILEVRIVHGKGTGALRETVHAILRRLPYVARFRLAGEDAGGWGATLVTLRRR